jgi:hypothetical protein
MANPNNNPQQQTTQLQQQRSEEPQAPQATRTGGGEKHFRVKEEVQVARGGSHFTLTKGKLISSFGYDIHALKTQGVQLEEVA